MLFIVCRYDRYNARMGSDGDKAKRWQFSIRFLFFTVAIACVIAWAVSAPFSARWVGVTFLLSLAGATTGGLRRKCPIIYGTIFGGASVVGLVFCDWSMILIGFFFHNESWPYFEDGVVIEVFFYPILYCMVYAPIGAYLGAITGCVVRYCLSSFGRS